MLEQLGQALAAGDVAAMVAMMADDVALRVAVYDTPFEGVQAAAQILGIVLDGVVHNIKLIDTIGGDSDAAVLLFSAQVAGYPGRADGLLVTRTDEAGRIVELTVFVRPLAALQALADEMGLRLRDRVAGPGSPHEPA